MKEEYIWNYIGTHQDGDFKDIAQALQLKEETVKSLVFDWALGDREKFNKRLN